MKKPIISKKEFISFIIVTSLFALCGFANAITDPMVQAFKKVLELSNSQAAWVQMAFYGGYFCMALMFPMIYGIALNGLNEEESKIGAAGLVMAIVGGALMPKLQGMVIDVGGTAVNDMKIVGVSEVNFSFILPLFCFVYIAWYGLQVFRIYEKTTSIIA